MIHCKHKHFTRTGLTIIAEYGKSNLPGRRAAVQSFGWEAWCDDCKARLIEHAPALGFAEIVVELEEI